MSARRLGVSAERSTRAPSGTSDADLLRAIAARSVSAFVVLRNRYGRAVARVCRATAGPEAEDCEQEVFARIWTKASLFDPARGSAAAWLLTIARRTALNGSPARRPAAPLVEAGEAERDELDAFWLEAALAQLSDRERTVIELAYSSDLSERAIAARLEAPLGSVKSWKRRGLNRLAELLREDMP